ncbi:MAG: tetratricopeptide repeat protein [Calditrichales bacterium]|nr:MAG: tetratricopeptide repeat protein [Calditrichales bacterium]
MKSKVTTWLIIWLLVLTGKGIQAQDDPESLFLTSNRAYTEGRYQEAVEGYLKILDQKIESGEVFFNLGNAYYKLGQIGPALLYYEKARKYLEGDPGLEQNIELAQLKIVDEIEEIPKIFFEIWWLKLTHMVSIHTMLWFTLGCFTLFIALIITLMLKNYRILYRLVWTVSVAFVLLFIITAGQIYEFETSRFGIILAQKVSVQSEPGLSATEVFILHEGTRVKVNREFNDWLEITIADGKTGWMPAASLGTI